MKSQRVLQTSPPDRTTKVLLNLLFYTVLMVTMPVTMYFVSNRFFINTFNMKSSDSYIYAAAVAVVTVHIILALFVYKAYKEEDVPVKQD